MSSSRRHLLYLILFLVPTLAVGGGTLWLLHREQQRLNEQTRAAETARIAAIDARARLIAENLELVISDVETGLMTALYEAPKQNPETYLANWRRTNPLVHNVFIASIDGRPQWGAPDSATAQFIADAPWRERRAPSTPREFVGAIAENKTSEVQRLAATPVAPEIEETAETVAVGLPVTAVSERKQETTADVFTLDDLDKKDAAPAVEIVAEKSVKIAPVQQSVATGNVTQYQSARIALNRAANTNIQSLPAEKKSKSDSSEKIALNREKKSPADFKNKRKNRSATKGVDAGIALDEIASAPLAEVSAASEMSIADFSQPVVEETKVVSAPSLSADAPPPVVLPAVEAVIAEATKEEVRPQPTAVAVQPEARARTKTSDDNDYSLFANGWTPWTAPDGTPHLFGWWLTSRDHPVLLVEVNLSAVASRLGDFLPANIEPGEAYALRQHDNTTLHQVGFPSSAAPETSASAPTENPRSAKLGTRALQPVIVVPLATTLPSWSVAGYSLVNPLEANHAANRTFFMLGALLIAATIATILAAGGLLWRQARLSAAESAQKTSFVANVSHEFKTPLTTIRLYSELLEQGRIRDETKRAESLQTISRETQRLARLVNNVLDFSRLEQGRKKFDFAEHDLNAELNRLLDRHAPRLAEAGMRLEREFPSAPCMVKTDLDAVEQIVINLLDNACKYAASGGEVLVSSTGFQPVSGAAKHGQDAHATINITVADRGPGIPSSHREKIFDKFHRVDDTLTAAQGGSGLGLSIARQLARGLGGDLTHAPRKGGGCEFTLTLRAS